MSNKNDLLCEKKSQFLITWLIFNRPNKYEYRVWNIPSSEYIG